MVDLDSQGLLCHPSDSSPTKLPDLRILTPPMETPDPPSDTPGASKQVFLTPHDIPRILREDRKKVFFRKEILQSETC